MGSRRRVTDLFPLLLTAQEAEIIRRSRPENPSNQDMAIYWRAWDKVERQVKWRDRNHPRKQLAAHNKAVQDSDLNGKD